MIKYVVCFIFGFILGVIVTRFIDGMKAAEGLLAEVPMEAMQAAREEPEPDKWTEDMIRQARNMWRYDGTETGQEDRA